jgi:hypothetical protein
LRVCDFAGAGGTLKLTLPKAASETFSCDLVEANASRQESRGKTLVAPLKAFAPATFKVHFQ